MDRKHIKLSDIEIPQDIFTMEEKQRNELVLLVKTFLERILHREFGIRGNKKELLNKLIDSTIIVNEQEEKYEICEVMKQVKQLINESTH